MSNNLGLYNPIFYAQEALIWLQKRLGLATRVHVGYDRERRTFEKGDTISIRRPSTFTAQTAPLTVTQDLNTESVSITLDKWMDVGFALTDKELAYTGPNTAENPIIREHLAPAAYALADYADQQLAALAVGVPHAYVEPSAATAPTVAGILSTWKALFDLKCPTTDEDNMHFMIGGQEHATLAGLSAFSQWQGAGQEGVMTQMKNQLGQRYGFNFFTNQNRTTAAYADITDFAGAINNASGYTKGATSIAVDGLGTSEVIKKGSILKITSGTDAGSQYAVTADVTLSSGGGTLVINPPLRAALADNDTFAINDLAALNQGAAGTGALDNVTDNLNLAFHRHWAAIAMARLPDYSEVPGQYGTQIASVQDPVTGLAIRARTFYDPKAAKLYVVLDILFGVKELNADLACRYEVKAA